METTFDLISHLHARIASSFGAVVEQDPTVRRPGQLCDEPAASWAVDEILSGRPVPVNGATVRALQLAELMIRQRAGLEPPNVDGARP